MGAKVRVSRAVVMVCDKCRCEGPAFGMIRRDTLASRLKHLARFYKPGAVGLFGDDGTKIGRNGAWRCAACKPG